MQQLTCSTCNEIKNLDQFFFFKKRKTCILCRKKEVAIYDKNRYDPVKDKIYRDKKKDEIKKRKRKYYLKNKSKIDKRNKDYNLKHKEKLKKYYAAYAKDRRKKDFAYKLRNSISNRVGGVIKNNLFFKNKNSILKFLPYSMNELKLYLESKFESWMNWNNYGNYNKKTWNDEDQSTWKWNIDHIIPQSKLQYSSMEDENFKKCWALENLRPYSAKQNLIDGDR